MRNTATAEITSEVISPEVARDLADTALAARAKCDRTLDDVLGMVARFIPCAAKRTPECDRLVVARGGNPHCLACGWTVPTPDLES